MPKLKKKGKLIGFIGQGWIGKNYADNFEARGYDVVRYSLEDAYVNNREHIKECDIVFIAVPTPTVKGGKFETKAIEKVLPLIGKGKTAVIKSTILPGTTERLQKKFPNTIILHSPEFLTEATAARDAAYPDRNIVGMPVDSERYKIAAQEVVSVLAPAPYTAITGAREAELIKYGGNCWFFTKVIFINILYDLVEKSGANWAPVRDGMAADPRIGRTHLDPIHKSGRGAGGHCFIKDFAAFRAECEKMLSSDKLGLEVLRAMEKKNIKLLKDSNKDLDLLFGVYGKI